MLQGLRGRDGPGGSLTSSPGSQAQSQFALPPFRASVSPSFTLFFSCLLEWLLLAKWISDREAGVAEGVEGHGFLPSLEGQSGAPDFTDTSNSALRGSREGREMPGAAVFSQMTLIFPFSFFPAAAVLELAAGVRQRQVGPGETFLPGSALLRAVFLGQPAREGPCS